MFLKLQNCKIEIAKSSSVHELAVISKYENMPTAARSKIASPDNRDTVQCSINVPPDNEETSSDITSTNVHLDKVQCSINIPPDNEETSSTSTNVHLDKVQCSTE